MSKFTEMYKSKSDVCRRGAEADSDKALIATVFRPLSPALVWRKVHTIYDRVNEVPCMAAAAEIMSMSKNPMWISSLSPPTFTAA